MTILIKIKFWYVSAVLQQRFYYKKKLKPVFILQNIDEYITLSSVKCNVRCRRLRQGKTLTTDEEHELSPNLAQLDDTV